MRTATAPLLVLTLIAAMVLSQRRGEPIPAAPLALPMLDMIEPSPPAPTREARHEMPAPAFMLAKSQFSIVEPERLQIQPAPAPAVLARPLPPVQQVAEAACSPNWTGALVYVEDPELAARNEPQPGCPPCTGLTNRLHGFARGTAWTLGLTEASHFVFVRCLDPNVATPLIVYVRNGKEVGRVEGNPPAGPIDFIFARHPLAAPPPARPSAYRRERLASYSAPVETYSVVEYPPVYESVTYSMPFASGCGGAYSVQASGCGGAYSTPFASGCGGAYSVPFSASGCAGGTSFQSFGTPFTPTFRRAYSAPYESCPGGVCPPQAGTQAGLFGGSVNRSYSLVNFGFGF